MQRDDGIRLRHMLDAAHKVIEFTRGKNETDFVKDEKLSFAVVRLIEIIGEAAKNISSETRQHYADLPWKEMAGTRDRLVHGYFDVDLDIIGKIISKDLPELVSKLQTIVSDAGEDDAKITSKQLRSWEQRLPDLDSTWTHWWLEAEDYCLAVISYENLRQALDCIAKNHNRFTAMNAYRAKIGADGKPIRQKNSTEIYNKSSNSKS